jgi:hypothetical protein
MLPELALAQARRAVLPEAVQTGDVTLFARENEHQIAGICY